MQKILIKEVTIDWEDFPQQVTATIKMKETPKVLKDKCIKQHYNGKCC